MLLAGFAIIVRTIKNKPSRIFYVVCHRHPTEKVMDCFSSSTITDNFCHLNDALNIFKILTQSVTLAVRANANVNCYCILFA